MIIDTATDREKALMEKRDFVRSDSPQTGSIGKKLAYHTACFALSLNILITNINTGYTD